MKYEEIYNALILKRQQNLVQGYSERHHIIPKCMNGSNDITNIVRLSAREHFIAHLLLAKMYGGKLIFAVWRMTNDKITGRKINNRQYENAKKKLAVYNSSDEKKLKLSIALTGRVFSTIHKKRLSDNRKGRKLSAVHIESIRKANTGLKRTQEFKDNLSAKLKGRLISDEWRDKISKSSIGRTHSEEAKKKIGDYARDRDTSYMRVKLVCPHCNKSGGFGMLRWHFDNCKFKESNEN